MPSPEVRSVWMLLLAVTLVTGLALGLFPALDLGASALFYRDGSGFWLAAQPELSAFRYALWYTSLGLVALSLVGLVAALIRRGPVLGIPGRVWGFILALYLIAPGGIVNLGLKAYWGRARPGSVVEFGGAQAFTPFWQIADECAKNCSFVSGEGSAAMALGVSLFVLIRAAGAGLPVLVRWAGLGLALTLPVLGGAQRLVTGRHFLSDTIMAMAIVAAVALVLHAALLRGPRRS